MIPTLGHMGRTNDRIPLETFSIVPSPEAVLFMLILIYFPLFSLWNYEGKLTASHFTCVKEIASKASLLKPMIWKHVCVMLIRLNSKEEHPNKPCTFPRVQSFQERMHYSVHVLSANTSSQGNPTHFHSSMETLKWNPGWKIYPKLVHKERSHKGWLNYRKTMILRSAILNLKCQKNIIYGDV